MLVVGNGPNMNTALNQAFLEHGVHVHERLDLQSLHPSSEGPAQLLLATAQRGRLVNQGADPEVTHIVDVGEQLLEVGVGQGRPVREHPAKGIPY